jgi:signal-transduction protein with cAMP-binding, CBS, and nucleotidyltransferase domain
MVMRLASLADAGVISRQDADTLSDAFAKLGEIRIQAHLHAGDANDNGGFAAPELRQVIQTLLPFVDRIEHYLADPTRPF